MAGELQYNSTFFNSLQAITDIDYIFPNKQTTYYFDVAGNGADGWTATIHWQTLIVDQVSYNRDETPNFDNSTIIGYYDQIGTSTEYTTGVIVIPSDMYTGKLLPASDRYVPITVVNFSWVKDGEEYSQNIAYIQQWTPGYPIGDPRDDVLYEPIEGIDSSLTLTGEERVIYEDTLTLTATTDIPIDIGTDNLCSFYAVIDSIETLIGTSYFSNLTNRATVDINTTDLLPIGIYNVYAKFGGRREYSKQTSNIFQVEVLEGIPLLVDSLTVSPTQTYYYPGDDVEVAITVSPDPYFPVSGVAINNPLTMWTRNGFDPNTTATFFSSNFSNGSATGNFTVDSSMIDVDRLDEITYWEITTSTQNSTQYTATLFVTNTETINLAWGFQTLGQYAKGSTSAEITVANTTSVTVDADLFPIIIDQDPSNTLQEESFVITVTTPDVDYLNDITIVATDTATGSTSTLYSGNQTGTSTFDVSVSTLSTGTYTIVATYPGDIGKNIYSANQAATSNEITHIVRTGNELDATFIYYTTGTNDILRVWATTSTTLTQTVSFYDDGSLLGTAEWSRELVNYEVPVEVEVRSSATFAPASFADNFTSVIWNSDTIWWGPGIGWASPNNDAIDDLTRFSEQLRRGWSVSADYYNNSCDMPSPILTNRYRLFKYYDGTNYQLEDVASSKGATIADPISFNLDWNVVDAGYQREFNLNDPFINKNTAFYNYVESRFGYTAMQEFLSTLETLDGQPLKINDLSFNDRPVASPPPDAIPVYPIINDFENSSGDFFLDRYNLDFAPTENDLSILNLPETYTIKVYQLPDYGLDIPTDRNLDDYYNPKYNQAVYDSYRDISVRSYTAFQYRVQGKNIPDGTVFYYEQIGQITEDELVIGSMTGYLTMQDNLAYADFACETTTDKIFQLRLRLGDENGEIVGLQTDRAIDYSGRNSRLEPGRGYCLIRAKYSDRQYDDTMTVSSTTVERNGSFTYSFRAPFAGSTNVYAYDSFKATGIYDYSAYQSKTSSTYSPSVDYPGYDYVHTGIFYTTFENQPVSNILTIRIDNTGIILKPVYITLTPYVPFVAITPGETQTVRQRKYDIYRLDTIGDERGYNVIGINSNTLEDLPTVSESNPLRLYFTGANNIERYIDLVEYIGETGWQKPIENAQQAAGTQSRSQINLWLFRFTPTIPQTNTVFRTQYEQTTIIDLDINNNWRPRPIPGFPSDFVWNDSLGKYRVDYYSDPNFPGAEYDNDYLVRLNGYGFNFDQGRIDYRNYGKKIWVSLNVNDPVENDKAAFYNDWFNTFTNPFAEVYTKAEYTTTYNTVTIDSLQNATLALPEGTISNTELLTATWPGTRYLDAIYGKFNPFNLSVGSGFTGLDLDAYQVTGDGSLVTATIVTSATPIDLTVTITSQPINLTANTGTVTFFNADTLAVIDTVSVSNNTATIRVVADDLISSGSSTVRIRSSYLYSTGFDPIYSDIVSLQAAVYSLPNSINLIDYNADNSITQQIFEYSNTLPNTIRYVNGSINVILPSVFSSLISGYTNYRITLTHQTSIYRSDTGTTSVWNQPIGVPSQLLPGRYETSYPGPLNKYYTDVPIIVNSSEAKYVTITLNNESLWITPEWWLGTRPGDPGYWPVAAPGIGNGYITNIKVFMNIKLLDDLSLPENGKIYYTQNLSARNG